jgi:hypothetical protein
MPLGQRVLSVTLDMPTGAVVLDQSIDLKVHVHKDALAVQNSCEIIATDLSQSLRESLLTYFTAWNKRAVEQGTATPNYVNMSVQAGYANAGQQSNVTTIFTGQVAKCGPIGSLPNLGVKIDCFTQQLNKTEWTTVTPGGQTTFKNYVQWAGQQMGLNVVCQTSYDNTVITNPGSSITNIGALLLDIQGYYHPNVAAYVDNNTLYVKDLNSVIAQNGTVTIDEFIDMPLWTEWGVEFECMFNPQLQLACAAQLQSKMNPSLNQSAYTIVSLDYDLASRDTQFYTKAFGCPPA